MDIFVPCVFFAAFIIMVPGVVLGTWLEANRNKVKE